MNTHNMYVYIALKTTYLTMIYAKRQGIIHTRDLSYLESAKLIRQLIRN